MNYFDATILGIIEGITEFLPISSTAHLILGAKILGLADTDFLKSFEIIIQLGAILAVVTFYLRSFFDLEVLKRVIVGFIPTGILGLIFYKAVKTYLGDVSAVLWALLIGGIILIAFEYWHKGRGGAEGVTTITLKQAALIGCFQSLAFIPGTSRSAATIVGGMALGISRATIAEFSFLLAVPTMLAATGLDAFKNRDLIMHSGNFGLLAAGFVVAYLVALAAIKLFLSYIRKHDFVPFGVYRIVIAIAGFVFLI